MLAAWEEMGRMLSWSSMTRHFLHEARERINLRNKTTVVRGRGATSTPQGRGFSPRKLSSSTSLKKREPAKTSWTAGPDDFQPPAEGAPTDLTQ